MLTYLRPDPALSPRGALNSKGQAKTKTNSQGENWSIQNTAFNTGRRYLNK